MVDLSVVQNLINGLVVLIVAVVALAGAGGVAAVVMIARQHKRSLEMAFESLPVAWQATIRDLIVAIGGVYDFVEDLTDGEDDPEGAGGAG